MKVELEVAEREARDQYADGSRVAKLLEKISEATQAAESIVAKWDAEKTALEVVRSARAAFAADSAEAGDVDTESKAQLRRTLDDALATLAAAQGDDPMVFAVVGADAVAAVVGDWTGIPVGRMVRDEIQQVLALEGQLKTRVIGQDHAMSEIAKRIKTSRAKLDNPNKPVGVFMLCEDLPGLGKTETAHALAELLYAGDDSMIVINMSEFQEAHTVSTLKGAPAGYVGYGQGGVLTEAVRRRPYSVVLLDEVEKAHPDIHRMFLQVFDKGYMDDAEGRYIDFKNTFILLTSNVGADLITTLAEDPELTPEPDALAEALRPELLKVFPPELLGRLIVQPYFPLSPTVLAGIVQLQLGRIQKRFVENHGVALAFSDDVIKLIVSRCNEVASGGRVIDAILTNTMLPQLSVLLLERQLTYEPMANVLVSVRDGAFAYDFDEPAPAVSAPANGHPAPALAPVESG